MRLFLIVLVIFVVALSAFVFSCNATTPKLDFDEESCAVLVTPQGCWTPNMWFICIHGNTVGLILEEDREDTLCETSLTIVPHVWTYIGDYVDCDEVVPSNHPTWGTLKSAYR